METPETPVSSHPDLAELQAQFASLRQTVVSLLVLIIVLSGSFNLYLLRQVNYSRKDLENIRQQAGPVITDYQTNSGLAMDTFIQKLQEYGRVHPDFQGIIKKYGLDKPAPGTTNAATATPPAAAAPATATSTSKK